MDTTKTLNRNSNISHASYLIKEWYCNVIYVTTDISASFPQKAAMPLTFASWFFCCVINKSNVQ